MQRLMTAHRRMQARTLFFFLLFETALVAQEEIRLPRALYDQEATPPRQPGPPVPQDDDEKEDPDTTSFYPIPAIASGKNEGWTYGLLGALLLPDKHGDINMVFSAAVQYRSKIKINGFLDFRWTPSPTAVFEAYSYWAENIENQNQVFYDNKRLWKNFNFRFDFDERRIVTERFFGRGSETRERDESAYTSNTYLTQLRFGPYLADPLSLQATFRFRHFRVGESLLTDLPQTRALYPNEFGMDGGHVWGEGLRLTYDTRNNVFTPTQGEYGVLFAEMAHYALNDSLRPFQVFGLEAMKLWPHTEDAQFVTVVRFKTQFVIGDAPFWELSTLGGGSSLRGFGPTRFVHNDMWVLNVEERIRLFEVRVEGVTGEVQLAPFIDVGEVFSHTSDDGLPDMERRIHWSAGSGFRAVVQPYIVGRMDIGFGSEGLGITVGLDYPF
jgi:outer membrane protein assembly factor BamA